MELSRQYFNLIREANEGIFRQNRETLRELGAVIGKSIGVGGILHTFGSGHSAILARELVHRAGGLATVSAIVDPTGGWVETLPGYGTKLVEKHHSIYDLKAGETVIVISNSGKNPCPIEVALKCKSLGLTVAALTSLPMSQQAVSNHPSGKRLFEVADYVLDNGGKPGDAAVEIPGHSERAGPTSTLTGALLLNLLLMEIVEYLSENDLPLPLLVSANSSPDARACNEKMVTAYKHRLHRPL